ncbi:MAG: hypothetical protein L2C94_002220 [Aigarchaeota archaeon]|nr:hypothetical protein [Candidatus Wolframiiraptor gerlachensis]
MIVCEYEFEKPDTRNPRYSLVEADVYGWIPEEFWDEIRDHRLSLRKSLKMGKFELYRYYYADGSEELIFTGSLEECLRRAEAEWKRFHYGWAGVVPEFKPCRHRPPDISSLCPMQRAITPI